MIVYFSASARNMERDIEAYRTIIRAIQETGGIIAHNWVEAAAFRGDFPTEELWWTTMQHDVQRGLRDIDMAVVEASGASAFGVGYELATALHSGKPVLALVSKKAKGSSYVRGIRHPALTYAVYEPHTLADLVKDFIVSKGNQETKGTIW